MPHLMMCCQGQHAPARETQEICLKKKKKLNRFLIYVQAQNNSVLDPKNWSMQLNVITKVPTLETKALADLLLEAKRIVAYEAIPTHWRWGGGHFVVAKCCTAILLLGLEI